MRSSIKDIARVAGVSTATVSRALNNKGPMREDTKAMILDLASRMHYRRNVFARNLSISKTETIGLIMPELMDDFYTSFFNGIDKEAQKSGYQLMVCSSHSQRDATETLLEFMNNGKVDGVILMAPFIHKDVPEMVAKSSLPIVTINSGTPAGGMVAFNVDNYQGAYAMAEHLIGHGYSTLGTIRGPEGNFDADARFAGFADALKKHAISLDESLVVVGDFTARSAFYGFIRLMSQEPKPEAIFVSNDMMAVGAYEAAKKMEMSIPEDVAIAGFDGIFLGRILSPQLSTVHVPLAELATMAFHRLVGMLNKDMPPDDSASVEVISSGLLIRESCGCSLRQDFIF